MSIMKHLTIRAAIPPVKLHSVDNDASMGVLDGKISDCLYKAMGIEALLVSELKTPLALHPPGGGIDIPKERFAGRTVRAFFGGHLYPEKPEQIFYL